MKRPCHAAYQADDTERSEAALLSVWPKLADYHEDLVLVGGLVPRYLCHRDLSASEWQPRTLDVDLAIALAAGGGMYAGLSERLRSDGFTYVDRRFVKEMKGINLHVDLLTERPSEDAPTSATVDDVTVSAFFGVDRALQVYRECLIEGDNLDGAHMRAGVKVCEVGPFLCLKLQAYAKRAERKDVFDFIHTLRYYDLGTAKAVAAFWEEAGINLAFETARGVLAERFGDERSVGPVDYAAFCLGDRLSAGDDAGQEAWELLTTDAVTAAAFLLAGGGTSSGPPGT